MDVRRTKWIAPQKIYFSMSHYPYPVISSGISHSLGFIYENSM